MTIHIELWFLLWSTHEVCSSQRLYAEVKEEVEKK